MMNIGIEIDTGGTYTDAVIYDFSVNKVLHSAKSLTTKDDLSIGILNVLDKLPYDLIKDVKLISLSTTLATNACVEDKGGKSKLIFFGGDKRVIGPLGGKYGLPDVNDVYIQESFTKFSGEIEKELDWDMFESQIDTICGNNIEGIGVIEIFAMKNNAVIEKKAKEIINKHTSLPVVCSHELFSDLNCLQRGAGTLLNAQLFPIIKDFINAIKTALSKRNIIASLIIVRSDGSLMSEEFAYNHPVETLICGPASSVLGSVKLVDEPNGIVIDMGGTTTDIALIKNNVPIKVKDGVSIGKWRTYVKGLYLKTIGLGGDSAVHYDDGGNIYLEDYRVIPLCIGAQQYPVIAENLKNINYDNHFMNLHEHYILIKDNYNIYNDDEKRICDLLIDNPMSLSDIAGKLEISTRRIDLANLLKDGIIQICGFTPTDVMHIKGDFNNFDTECSRLGAEYIARRNGLKIDELCDIVYDEVKRKIYLNVICMLLENENNDYMTHGISDDVKKLILDSWDMSDFLKFNFKTDFKLIGIGAPVHIFLEDVAKRLNTEVLIPKYHEVANAVGAIASDIYVNTSVEIKPVYSEMGITGYTVYGINEFEEYNDAETFAINEAVTNALDQAKSRGATSEVNVSYEIIKNDAKARDGLVYLGTVIKAYAICKL